MDADGHSLSKPRDEQQRRVIERLRAARGEPVDFEELLAIGVEHPAVVCYELELSGVPIVQQREANRLLFSLPVAAESPPAGVPPRAEPRPGRRPLSPPEPMHRRPATIERPQRSTRRPVRGAQAPESAGAPPHGARLAVIGAAAALGALVAVVLAIAPSDHRGGARGVRAGAAHTHASAPPAATAERARARGNESPREPRIPEQLRARTPPVPVSAVTAAALESEGHQLLAAGRYSTAIDRLLGAIRASGRSLAQCREPTSESCLTFAYALYDLGRALRLGGDPSAAIPVLEQRLRIDNQRPVVRQELSLARGAGA